MFRNREIKLLCAALLGITGFFSVLAFLFDMRVGGITLCGMLALSFVFLGSTFMRYREIARLSDYLTRIREGNYWLDVRDNREGELSILKNDIYKMTLTLSEQAELLKKDKKYLADSLADISHQLKTPLTSIIMMTDLLSDGDLPEEKRREFTEVIHSQLSRIEWLVSSLLKLSKIDAGAIRFRRDRLPVGDVVRRAVQPLGILMELREQRLLLEGDASIHILGDEPWLAEAIYNIVKDCVEHTDTGGTIRITWTDNPLHTGLTIEDDGNGISPEDLPHIFERFYKGKDASPESVGIGLAMAKAILLNHDADISVQSEYGKYTRFTIHFFKQVL